MNNIEKRMQELKPSGLSGGEKEQIWSAMETQLSRQKSFSVLDGFPTFKTIRRVSVPLVVALGLILGSGATVYAHEAALPGDFLFPVKIQVEKAQIFLAHSEKKDELRIKFSEKRLNEVRIIVASSPSVMTSTGTSTTATTSSTTTGTSTTPNKKTVRTERAIAEALKALEETKASLALSGSGSGVLILEDIINELKGVGNGTVTITKVAMNGGKKHDNDVKIHATITSTSTGTTTANTVMRVKFEEKKNGTKIEIKTKSTSDNDDRKEEKEEKHESKNDRDDDDEDDNRGSKKHDDDDDDDEDDDKKARICHKTDNGAHTINVSVKSARAHMKHGDKLGACSGGTATTTPDTTLPTLTSIAVNATATGATITWATNENATGKLYLGTTSPVTTNRATDAEHTTLVTSHSLVLSPLLPSTTYYYVVVSKDASGNSATSSIASFSTPALPPVLDTTAPVISGIVATSIAGTTTISFATNESTTGRIYVGTTNPLVIGTATSMALLTATTTHSAIFTGLATSTTHYYVIVAKDASANTATSSQGSFLAN